MSPRPPVEVPGLERPPPGRPGLSPPPGAGRGSYGDLLRSRPQFARLWLGQSVSYLGDTMTTVAVSVGIYSTTRSPYWVAAAFVAKGLGTLVVTPVAGRMADSVERRRLLISLDLARLVLIALMPVALVTFEPAALFDVFLIQICTTLFQPSLMSSLPTLVGISRTTRANSLVTFTQRVIDVVGYPLAGMVALLSSVAFLFWVDSASYLMSALFLLSMSVASFARASPVSRGLSGFRRGLRLGLGKPRVRYNLLLCFGAALPLGAAMPMLVVFSYGHLRFMGSLGFSLLLAALGIGASLGALVAARLDRNWRFWAVGLGTLISGLALIGFGISTVFALALLMLVASGIGNSLFYVSNQSEIQDQTPEAIRGRVLAGRFAGAQVMMVLGAAASGLLEDRLGGAGAYVACGVLLSVWALTVLAVAVVRPGYRAVSDPESEVVQQHPTI